MELKAALAELRKEKGRKFDQTVDLIVNLKGIDMRKDNISVVASLPHLIKDKKVCAFLTAKNDLVPTITKAEFPKYTEKKALRSLVKNYDFFIAHASLMPSVATTFGKVLGPTGKMPTPQLGILTQETPETIKQTLAKIAQSVKVRAKQPSVKVAIGRTGMKDEEIIENIMAVYNALVAVLPTKQENVKNIMIKFTMTKALKVEVK